MKKQTTNTIVMVRPANFCSNQETAATNRFQKQNDSPVNEIQQQAEQEFDQMVATLSAAKVNVVVIQDTSLPKKPDAIFPNNWFTTHQNGQIIFYPMEAKNRHLERRLDVIDLLYKKHRFYFSQIINLETQPWEPKFLEGTGSLILDRVNQIAYMGISTRSDPSLLAKFCKTMEYSAVTFHAADQNQTPIYHTNVMMSVGEKFAILCKESISSKKEQEAVIHSLEKTGKKVIEISYSQMNAFAGNALELQSQDGESLLAISEQAWKSLQESQQQQIKQYCQVIPIPVYHIEKYGGGSVRCMIAEIFLPKFG